MNTEVAKPVAGLPAHLQAAVTAETFDEFAGGVTSGFPVISYKGRTWRVRKGGEEQVYLNDEQEAVQSIEVVLLKSNPLPSKVFYKDKYNEGDSGPPDCWSANGIKPDDNVKEAVALTCAACPNNVWGSKITDSGQKTRACSDVRRCAVAFKYQLEEFAAGERELKDIDVLLLRIPPATLNPLKDYVEEVLKPKGVAPYMLITKIGFDTAVAYPKLTFKGLRFLNAEEFAAAETLRDGEDSRRILNEASENVTDDDAEGSTDGTGQVSGANAQAPAEAGTKAPSASPKLQPVEEEELAFSEETDDIAPAPARAAAVEAEAEQVEEAVAEEIAPAPPPAKKRKGTSKKKIAKKTKPAEPAVEATPPAPAAPPADDEFDAMLSSILD